MASWSASQGVGFQSSVAHNPARAYAGTYFETALFAGRIHFCQSIGNGLSALVDVMFEYKLPIGTLSGWTFY